MNKIKISLLVVALLLGGCTTPKIAPIESRHFDQMHQGLFPFSTHEYNRLDDIDGLWTQVGWDIFPQKTPWDEPAEVFVSHDKVTFTVKPWALNSETIKDNERALLSLFFKFDYEKYPRSMFRRNKAGYIVLTVDRSKIYIQGANKQGVDFLGIGIFDPPMVLQRKAPNQSLQITK